MRLFLGGHRETNMERIKWYLVLHLAFFIYAVCSAMAITAARQAVVQTRIICVRSAAIRTVQGRGGMCMMMSHTAVLTTKRGTVTEPARLLKSVR